MEKPPTSPIAPPLGSLALAVPFTGGVLVAALTTVYRERLYPEDPRHLHTSVVKLPWGLLTAAFPANALEEVRVTVLRSKVSSFAEMRAAVATALRPSRPPCLLTYEAGNWWGDAFDGPPQDTVARLGSPVELYRLALEEPETDPSAATALEAVSQGRLTRVTWGSVLDPGGLDPATLRDGTLHLQWGLDRGKDFDSRLEAVLETFAWFREQVPSLPGEVDFGVHEPGHRFSVDRTSI